MYFENCKFKKNLIIMFLNTWFLIRIMPASQSGIATVSNANFRKVRRSNLEHKRDHRALVAPRFNSWRGRFWNWNFRFVSLSEAQRCRSNPLGWGPILPWASSIKMTVKRLYRSKKDRILGGVCGGLGEFFKIDPTIIRLVWALLTLLSIGLGIIAYLLAWIIIPEKH